MKKILLLSFALAAVTLQAAPQIQSIANVQQPTLEGVQPFAPSIAPLSDSGPRRAHKTFVTPEGTPQDYMMKYNQGTTTYPDRPVQVSFSEDGKSVYFGNLFPGFLTNDMGAWIKGDIQEDSTIVVKLQHFMDYDLYGDESMFYNFYAGSMDLTAGVMGDAILVLHADGSITQQDPSSYLWLGAYLDGAYAGYISYETDAEFTPAAEKPELVTVPETAVFTEAIYDYTNAYGNNNVQKGQVATDGNDVYFLGLVPETNAWVKGTKEGNTVTLKNKQFIGEGAGYLLELGFLQARSDFSAYEPVDEITLTYNPDMETYSQVRNSETDDYFMIVEQTLSGTIYLYNFDFNIKIYDGPKASIPQDPFDLVLYDFAESSQRYALMFSNSAYGTDGYYLEPENLFYYIYLDDEILTFDTETYTTLPEEMTLIPWDFTASNSDIYGSALSHYAYIYELLIEKAGVQFVHIFEGTPYYSNIVSIDFEGNVTTVEVENPNGIADVGSAKVNGMQYYNAAGQRLNGQQKGFNLVKVTLSDGSQKTYKMYIK